MIHANHIRSKLSNILINEEMSEFVNFNTITDLYSSAFLETLYVGLHYAYCGKRYIIHIYLSVYNYARPYF